MGERALATEPPALATPRAGLAELAPVLLLAVGLLAVAWLVPRPPLPGDSAVDGRLGALLGGALGLAVANVVALALAAGIAVVRLRERLGSAIGIWVALVVAASALPFAVLRGDGGVLAAALLAVALAVAMPRATSAPVLAEVYQPEEPGGAACLSRLAIAALLVGLAGGLRPLALWLLVVLAAGVGRQAARLGTIAAAGIAGWLMVRVVVGGLPSLVAIALPEIAMPEPRLVGWNALYLLAGETIGLLPYLLPLVVALALAEQGPLRTGAVLALAGAALATLLLHPFDLAGPAVLGNSRLLVFAPLAWFLPARLPRRSALLAMLVAAGLFLAPAWRDPARTLAGGADATVSPLARRLLPHETSQRDLAGVRDVRAGELRVRTFDGRTWSGADGSLRLLGGVAGELLVGSPERLYALRVGLDGRVPSNVEVPGHEIGDTTFRPDGGVVLSVRLRRPRAIHPAVPGGQPLHFYALRLLTPGAAPVPLRLDLEGVRDDG